MITLCKGGEDISRGACGSVKMGCFRSAGEVLGRLISREVWKCKEVCKCGEKNVRWLIMHIVMFTGCIKDMMPCLYGN